MSLQKPNAQMRSWRVFLVSCPDGRYLEVRCLRSGLTAGESAEFLASERVPPAHALLCGSPYALTLRVRFDARFEAMAERLAPLRASFVEHVTALRAVGVFAVRDAVSGDAAGVADTRLPPPMLVRYFAGLGPREVLADCAGPAGPEAVRHQLEHAHADSIAGVLRSSRAWDSFVAWVVGHAHPARLGYLSYPLLATATDREGAHARFAGWVVRPEGMGCGYAGLPVMGLFVKAEGSALVVPYWVDGGAPATFWPMALLRDDTRDPVFPKHPQTRRYSLRAFPDVGRMHGLSVMNAALWDPDGAPPLPDHLLREIDDAWIARRTDMRLCLLEALDSERLSLAPELEDYNYINAEGDPGLARNRTQVAKVAPLILRDLSEKRARRTRQAVDAGLPLWPAVASDYAVPHWAARRVGRLDSVAVQAASPPNRTRPDRILRIIEALGPEAPIDDTFMMYASDLIRLREAEFIDDRAAAIMHPMIACHASHHGWSRTMAWVVDYLYGGPTPELADYLRFVVQVVRRTLPEDVAEEQVTRVTAQMFRGCTLSQLTDLVNQWHAAVVKWSARRLGATDDDALAPRLFEPISLGDPPFEIRHLVSAAELHREGQEMRHCVGTYVDRVAAQASVIAAICAKAIDVRITAEFSMTTMMHWELIQACWPGNAPVQRGDRGFAMVEEVHRLLERLARDMDREQLRRYVEGAQRGVVLRNDLAELDDVIARGDADFLEIFAPCLPGREFPGAAIAIKREWRGIARAHHPVEQSATTLQQTPTGSSE